MTREINEFKQILATAEKIQKETIAKYKSFNKELVDLSKSLNKQISDLKKIPSVQETPIVPKKESEKKEPSKEEQKQSEEKKTAREELEERQGPAWVKNIKEGFSGLTKMTSEKKLQLKESNSFLSGIFDNTKQKSMLGSVLKWGAIIIASLPFVPMIAKAFETIKEPLREFKTTLVELWDPLKKELRTWWENDLRPVLGGLGEGVGAGIGNSLLSGLKNVLLNVFHDPKMMFGLTAVLTAKFGPIGLALGTIATVIGVTNGIIRNNRDIQRNHFDFVKSREEKSQDALTKTENLDKILNKIVGEDSTEQRAIKEKIANLDSKIVEAQERGTHGNWLVRGHARSVVADLERQRDRMFQEQVETWRTTRKELGFIFDSQTESLEDFREKHKDSIEKIVDKLNIQDATERSKISIELFNRMASAYATQGLDVQGALMEIKQKFSEQVPPAQDSHAGESSTVQPAVTPPVETPKLNRDLINELKKPIPINHFDDIPRLKTLSETVPKGKNNSYKNRIGAIESGSNQFVGQSLNLNHDQSRITSGFGWRNLDHSPNHKGWDFATPLNTTLKSPFPMTLTGISSTGPGGNELFFKKNNYTVGFSHLNAHPFNNNHIGKTIPQGVEFARTGNTGRSGGPHLHLGVSDGFGNSRDFLKNNASLWQTISNLKHDRTPNLKPEQMKPDDSKTDLLETFLATFFNLQSSKMMFDFAKAPGSVSNIDLSAPSSEGGKSDTGDLATKFLKKIVFNTDKHISYF